MTDTLTPPTPQLDRDRYGRPLVYPTPDANKPVPYTRTTTFVSALEDTYNLNRWQQRNVALGLAERPDLLLAVTNSRDDKTKLNKLCDDAAEAAKARSAANIGTALHGITERLDRGDDIGTIPADYAPDIAAYQTATAHLDMIHIERFMVLDTWRIGGTPDRIIELDGKRRILDLKTGNIEYGIAKIAQQLAVYARSMLYDPATRERAYAEVENDWGIVAHLPAGQGQCRLYRIDLEAGWRGVRLSKWVRDWRAQKFDHFATELVAASPVLELIQTAPTLDALYRIWTNYEPVWTDDLTQAAAERKAELAPA
jgi:PD-(D/E)XK nuclease superfamily